MIVLFLRTVRHFAFSPPEIKFYVLCSCKQDKIYDTAEDGGGKRLDVAIARMLILRSIDEFPS